VIVPVREVTVPFALYEKVSVAGPVPEAGVTVSHTALDEAVHGASPGVAVRAIAPFPAAELPLVDAGLTEYEVAAPLWLTANVRPPIVSVPVLALALALAPAL
jgi:hypothetical protein